MKRIYNKQLFRKALVILLAMLYLLPAGSYAGGSKPGIGSGQSVNISLPLSTCLSESFTDPAFPPVGWETLAGTRSTTAANVNTAPAAAILTLPIGTLTTPELTYPQTLTVYIGRGSNNT